MQPYQPPKKKRHVLRWILLGVVLVIVVIIIAAVASSGGKKNVATTGTTVTSGVQTTAAAVKTSTSAKAPKTVPAHVGTTINLKSGGGEPEQLAVTLVAVLNNAPPTDTFSTPDAGNMFYAVQYRLVNTGSSAYSDSPSNGAVVVDAKGQQFQSDFNDTKAGPSFPGAVTIIPGGNALGWITFQVPVGTVVTAAQFGLQSGFGSAGQWSIP